MTDKQKRWKLTKDERERLKILQSKRNGLLLLLEDVALLKASLFKDEGTWWKDFKATHGIDDYLMLIADSDTGYARLMSFEEQVKAVERLDDRQRKITQDSLTQGV